MNRRSLFLLFGRRPLIRCLVLVSGLCLVLPMARAAELRDQLAGVKAARSDSDLRQRLLDLGFSKSLLDKLATVTYGSEAKHLFASGNLKRAEMWKANLNPSPATPRW